jgi:hypothetical protein
MRTNYYQAFRIVFFLALSIQFFGCMESIRTEIDNSVKEAVLNAGETICATKNVETICISSCNIRMRKISWQGSDFSITLIPREKRWHGKLGLISPNYPDNMWKTNNKIIRVSIQEAYIYYSSVGDFNDSLDFPKIDDRYNVVYNDDGILLMWYQSELPDHTYLDVSIFQILINGEKPTRLDNSQNDKIVILPGTKSMPKEFSSKID